MFSVCRAANLRAALSSALIASAIMATPASAAAPVVYVDQGSVGGRCSDVYTAAQAASRTTPWCSMAKAARSAPADAIAQVRRATYVTPTIANVQRTSNVTFEPYAAEASQVRLAGLTIDASKRLTFRGFEITGSDKRVSIMGSSSDLAFSDNYLHDLRTGFYMRDGGTNITIDRNRIINMLWGGLAMKDGYGLVLVSGGWTGLQIRDNTINGTDGDGLQLGGFLGGSISGNTITNVRVSAANSDHADAIQVSGSMTNVMIARNRISRSNNAIIVGSSAVRTRDNITFDNNVIYDISNHCMNIYDTQRLVIRHNTCWDSGYGVWLRDESISPTTHTKGAQVYNNIFGQTTRVNYSLDNQVRGFADWGTEDHNLVVEKTSTQTFSSTDTVAPSATQVSGLFVNVASRDLRPALGSILINKGIRRSTDPATDFALNARLYGIAPDQGAYEKGA